MTQSSVYAITQNSAKQYEVTAYTDATATAEDKVAAVKRLTACYPATFQKKTDIELSEFIQIFSEAIDAVGMTGKQLKDAVINCIATKHQYGQFQIADVTGFSDKIKLYTYNDYTRQPDVLTASKLKRADGTRWFVDKADLERANRLAEAKERLGV